MVVPGLIYLCVGVAHVYWGAVSMQTPSLLMGTTLGLLVSAQFAGFLVGVLTAPTLGRWVGFRRQIATALIVVSGALSTSTWVDTRPGLVAAGCVFGLAAGTLETQIGALALQHPDGARALTILEVFFGFGAVAFPVYLAVAAPFVSWQTPIVLVSGGILALLFAWLRYTRRGTDILLPGAAVSPSQVDGTIRDPNQERRLPAPAALVMLVFAFFYAGFETNFANFLPTVLGGQAAAPLNLLAVSVFWTGIVLGRIAATPAATALPQLRVLITLTTLLSVTLLICLTLASPPGIGFLLVVLLAGLLTAAVFPAALALCVRVSSLPTTIMTSYFVACASLGGAALALPVGWTVVNGGPRVTLALFAGFAAALVLLCGLAALIRARQDRGELGP